MDDRDCASGSRAQPSRLWRTRSSFERQQQRLQSRASAAAAAEPAAPAAAALSRAAPAAEPSFPSDRRELSVDGNGCSCASAVTPTPADGDGRRGQRSAPSSSSSNILLGQATADQLSAAVSVRRLDAQSTCSVGGCNEPLLTAAGVEAPLAQWSSQLQVLGKRCPGAEAFLRSTVTNNLRAMQAGPQLQLRPGTNRKAQPPLLPNYRSHLNKHFPN